MRATVVAALLLAPLLAGCITLDPAGAIDVRVLVTADFGTEVMIDRTIGLPAGSSAVDAARAVATVETSYGGGFVEAIDGLRSGYPDAKVDWFVEVNGVHSPVGGADVTLHDGDVVQWDHRAWDTGIRIAGLLNAWPRPLTTTWGGDKGTTSLIVDAELGDHTEELRAWLQDDLGVTIADEPADHVILATLRSPNDVLASDDPGRSFVRVDGNVLSVADGPDLQPPWGLLMRALPEPGAPTGASRVLLAASDDAGFELLVNSLQLAPPNAGVALAVNATVRTVVPP